MLTTTGNSITISTGTSNLSVGRTSTDCTHYATSTLNNNLFTDAKAISSYYDDIFKLFDCQPIKYNKEDKAKTPVEFEKIEFLCPDKVLRFTFKDGEIVKTVCSNYDEFDFEYAFYLAIAKKLYSKTLTMEGIEAKAKKLSYQKEYVKIVKKGIKTYERQLKEEEKRLDEKEERKAIKARREEKKRRKKEKAREARIAEMEEAIRRAK